MRHNQPSQPSDIGILKSVWKKNETAHWIVHDLQSLYLKPSSGFDDRYFKIKNEINLLTHSPGPIFENIFATFGTAEFLARQSIVPIVAWNDGDKKIRCIGTGFFISASGLLMTAAHVLRDPVDEEYTSLTQVGERAFKLGDSLRFGIMLPINPAMRNAPFPVPVPDELRGALSYICQFEWTAHWGKTVESPLFHEKDKHELDLDIAVCKVEHNRVGGSYQPLNIGRHNMKTGDRAVAIGYAEMKNISFDSVAEFEPELYVSVGSVTKIYPDNLSERQVPTPGPCFAFNAKILGKMSGSPILVGTGILTKGIVSRSWQGQSDASGALIAPMMGLPLKKEKSLLDLIEAGTEGIAQVSGQHI
jgi:hypothetical protein